MTYKLTLTPCRSNPRRYVRFITYRRFGDKVEAFRVTQEPGPLQIDPIRFREIQPDYVVDDEFAAEWKRHVREQHPDKDDAYFAW